MRKAGRFEVADKGTLFLDEVLRIAEESVPDAGVRPFALLARKYGVIDWVRAQKETWSNHGDWDRRAIIWSASVLPMGERRRVGSIWYRTC
jgi:hypothetical protein